MTKPIDMAALNLNLSSNGSPQQRLDTLLSRAGLGQSGNKPITAATGTEAANTGSGYLGDQVDQLNLAMRQYGLRFELSEFDSRVITQVVDRETGEVIRQIPAEEMLRIAEAFASDQGGRLVDASV